MAKRAHRASSDQQITTPQPDSNEAQSTTQPIKKATGKWIQLPVLLAGLGSEWANSTYVLIEFHTGTLEVRALKNEALRLIKSGKDNYPPTGKPPLCLYQFLYVINNPNMLVILDQVYRRE